MLRRWALMLFFWLLAGGVVLALFVLRQPNEQMLSIDLNTVGTFTDATLQARGISLSATTVLLEPQFTGRDQAGQQWELFAKTASRAGDVGADVIELQTLTAKLTTPQNQVLTIAAAYGQFNQTSEQLKVWQDVVLTGYGLRLNAPAVQTDLAQNTVTASAPVTIAGEFGGWYGELHGADLTLRNTTATSATAAGGELTLNGPVTGQFQPNYTTGVSP